MMQKQQIIAERAQDSVSNEPHFDEEWTVLSARPVVPIAELEAREKRLFSLKLFGSFLLASSLGVLVALAAIRLREGRARVTDTTASETIESIQEEAHEGQTRGDASTAINDQTTEASPAESSALSESSTSPENSTVEKPVTRSQRKQRNIAVDFDSGASDHESVDTNGSSKPQPKLVDEWQEGRPRRVQPKRPGTDGGAHHPRDLRNLDEIFEGSRP